MFGCDLHRARATAEQRTNRWWNVSPPPVAECSFNTRAVIAGKVVQLVAIVVLKQLVIRLGEAVGREKIDVLLAETDVEQIINPFGSADSLCVSLFRLNLAAHGF